MSEPTTGDPTATDLPQPTADPAGTNPTDANGAADVVQEPQHYESPNGLTVDVDDDGNTRVTDTKGSVTVADDGGQNFSTVVALLTLFPDRFGA